MQRLLLETSMVLIENREKLLDKIFIKKTS